MQNKKVNYRFDDLATVATKTLKMALGGYKMILKQRPKDNEAVEAYMRIETELLHRKELIVD